MHAWIDFFTTDYGLMSLAVLALMFGLMGYIGWFVARRVEEDTQAHDMKA